MISVQDMPVVKNCGVCQACLFENGYGDLEDARKQVRGRKIVLFNCGDVASGSFCIKHGKEMAAKVKAYVEKACAEVMALPE